MVGLGLVLAASVLLLLQANTAVGTEPGDVNVVAGELVDHSGTSLAPDVATGDPTTFDFHPYSIDNSSERRPALRLLLIGLLGRGPPF